MQIKDRHLAEAGAERIAWAEQAMTALTTVRTSCSSGVVVTLRPPGPASSWPPPAVVDGGPLAGCRAVR